MKPKESICKYANYINSLINQINSLSTPVNVIKDDDKVLVLTKGLPKTYCMVTITLHESSQFGNYQHVITSLLNEEMI